MLPPRGKEFWGYGRELLGNCKRNKLADAPGPVKIDDQPWPIDVGGGQKFIFVPYTGQTNDAGMLAWNREADYFQQMIKDQFDTLYREGAENGRVMCLALHPHNIGRPNAAKHLDEVLRYILGHDGVWATTADDIAECYLANYYDEVKSWIAERKGRVPELPVL